MQKAFIFDIDRCTGCQACQVACTIENQVAPDISWRQITSFNPDHHPGSASFHLSLACNHCIDAPCMKSCPASAYSKNPETGAVTIDAASCIGCGYCSWACPYDAPQFNRRTGVMEKCTFCSHRLADGKSPACVTACPTGALRFGDYEGAPGVPDVPGFPRVDVEPAIRFLNPRAAGSGPDSSFSQVPASGLEIPTTSKVTLRSEWSLVLFTLMAALLVGWMFAGLIGAAVHPVGFGLLGVSALIVSVLHLGQKHRAWRAILNWRSSWVSREIIGFSIFLATSGVHIVSGQRFSALAWASAAIGVLALFAMDRVYTVTATRGLRFHSARVLLVAPFIAGVIAGDPRIYIAIGGLRVVFYLTRKVRQAGALVPGQWLLGGARILLGMALPLAWTLEPSGSTWVPLVGIALGEVVDRAEYYVELDIPTPQQQAIVDLTAAVRAASP